MSQWKQKKICRKLDKLKQFVKAEIWWMLYCETDMAVLRAHNYKDIAS